MADLCRLSDAGALRDAIAGLAEAGCEEFVLVPTSGDLDELDRLLAAIG